MQSIKFSHKYYKMLKYAEIRKTYLIGVTKVHFNDLPESFIKYDTIYGFVEETKKSLYYPLPKTELIILTLFTDDGNGDGIPYVWTTIRRYIPKKYEYYQKLIGKQIEIIIEKHD